MIHKKKQINIKKIFTILMILAIWACMPLKAEDNNDGKVVIPKNEVVSTVVIDQIITPLEKPSIEASKFYELPKKDRTYNFSFDPLHINPQKTKYPQTYETIQNYKKTQVFEKSLFEVSLAANLALNVADYFSTKEALKYEGLKEGNPFMKPFVKDDMTFAAVKIGLTVSNYFLVKNIYKRNKTLGWIVSIVSNLALSYVVSSNMAHIHEARNR